MGNIHFAAEISDSLRERLESRGDLFLEGNAAILAVYDRSLLGRANAGIVFAKHYLTAFNGDVKMFAYEDIVRAAWDTSTENMVTLRLDLSYGETWMYSLHINDREQRRLRGLLSQNFELQEERKREAIPVRTKLPISTTSELGRESRIASVLGPVFGDAIVAIGGFAAARQRALDAMTLQADALGAQAIIGLHVQNVTPASGKSMVSAVGTAVSLLASQGPYR